MTNSNENIKYIVIISIDAQEFFESSSAFLQKKLARGFEGLKIEPENFPNIKSLKGDLSNYYRYCVGQYHVIYQIDDDLNQVTIILIGHRSRVYE